MSGGVDSSTSAFLLKEQGHHIIGVYMKNWVNEEGIPGECPWEEDLEDAKRTAEFLGIEFRVIDFTDSYRKFVVNPMLEDYRRGLTPNPDILCNREVKFGILLNYSKEQGFDGIATGHYARKKILPNEDFQILRGKDGNKDQSYFLSRVEKEAFRSVYFPLGNYTKPQVREIAKKATLPTADKKDSQGICFIGKVKISEFLSHFIPNHPGNIVDAEGKILGRHQGLHFYTLGQRKGHKIASPFEKNPYVVVGKDLEKNELILALDNEEIEMLYTSTCLIRDCVWILKPQKSQILAQIRYRTDAIPIEIQFQEGEANIIFAQKQKAISLGQTCAFYDGEILLGGGIFSEKKS